MPLNIGLIGALVKHCVQDSQTELRLYNDANSLLAEIDTWRPDVIGASNYVWNSRLSMHCLAYAKARLPDVVTISGGPNFPNAPEEVQEFLRQYPQIDFYAPLEAEVAVAGLVKSLLSGTSLQQLKLNPQDGLMAYSQDLHEVLAGKAATRPQELDFLPSPYLNGLMDKWFDGTWAPSVEFSRGCPYHCTYCVQGSDVYSGIARHSTQRIAHEMEYIAARMAPYPDIPLGICDSNFGMYKQDEEIADILVNVRARYGWPNSFDVTTGKSQYERILRISDKLDRKLNVCASTQSMNSPTLSAIKRHNLSEEAYWALIRELLDRRMLTSVELIVPLPGETKETYLNGIRKLMRFGVTYFQPYTTMMLMGTELSSQAVRKENGYVTKWRLLPQQFGEYRGARVFEIEEVGVATNAMPFEDYLECRSLGLVAAAFCSEQFDVFHKLTEICGLTRYDFIERVWNRIHQTKGAIYCTLKEYQAASADELFPTLENADAHYAQDHVYDKLLAGEVGDNLMRRFRGQMIMRHSREAIDVAFAITREYASATLLDELEKWVRASRDLNQYLNLGAASGPVELELRWDAPGWYEQGCPENLNDFWRPVKYLIGANIDELNEFVASAEKLCGVDLKKNPLFVLPRLLDWWQIEKLWLSSKKI
ncbi:MAG: hypothetical protein HQL44_05160 [Alphaproteobacteria bacterium]|nr:hypothetical protein [Alphaproteobacteria bacterium]